MGSNEEKFVNNTFSGDTKYNEKIHYIGDMRIVGQVVNFIEDKEPIGYVVMVERTQQFKMYTVGQTKVLLEKFKFVNADIENGKIVNTECSMTRMPKFDTDMNVIGNFGIIILGELNNGTTKIGYRAMDTNAKIVDLSEAELIKLGSSGSTIINAKIVQSDNKKHYISGIKKEFTKIEKAKLNEHKEEKKQTNPYIKKLHAEKLRYRLLPSTIRWGLTSKEITLINDKWYSRRMKDSFVDGTYLSIEREVKIIVKEIYGTNEYGITLSDGDKVILKKIVKEMPRKSLLNETTYAGDNERMLFFALAQFILNNEEAYNNLIRSLKVVGSKDVCSSVRYRQFNVERVARLVKGGYAGKALKKAAAELELMNREADKSFEETLSKAMKKEFTTTTFISGKDSAQLGFAVDISNKDMKYITNTGMEKSLKYIAEYFNNGMTYDGDYEQLYSKYKSMSTCLGDILAVANVHKLLGKEMDYVAFGEDEYLPSKQILASIEMIIAIAYLYNSVAMKEYVEQFKNDLEVVGVNIPDYNEISSTDYKLSSELKLYYSSGFNVFLNDNEYISKSYKREYLKNATFINYRQLGIKHEIVHPMLQNELASIVTMVTSDEHCDAETVERYIGRIRFL